MAKELPQRSRRYPAAWLLQFGCAWVVALPAAAGVQLLRFRAVEPGVLALLIAAAFAGLAYLNRVVSIVRVEGDRLVVKALGRERLVRPAEIAYVARSRREDRGTPFGVFIGMAEGKGLLRRRLVSLADGHRVFINWARAHGVRVVNDARRRDR